MSSALHFWRALIRVSLYRNRKELVHLALENMDKQDLAKWELQPFERLCEIPSGAAVLETPSLARSRANFIENVSKLTRDHKKLHQSGKSGPIELSQCKQKRITH